MSHHDAQGRIALTALIVTLFSLDMYIAFALAREQTFMWATVVPYGALMAVGLLAILLVWWRHRAGYACAVAWNPRDQPAWLTEECFVKQIQPRLALIGASALASALALSRPYEVDIKRGRRTNV